MVDEVGHSNEELVTISSLEAYFHDSMDAALAANRVALDDHTTHYVVNLLTLYSRSDALYEQTEDGYQLRPLAAMFADAVSASSDNERQQILKRVGDVALFIAGFFSAGLERAAVDVDYYVYMGGGAYHSLALDSRGARVRALAAVFDELAAKFQDLVDVLNEVRESARSESDTNVLRQYDLWIKTGSRRAERLLRSAGVHPMPQARVGYEH